MRYEFDIISKKSFYVRHRDQNYNLYRYIKYLRTFVLSEYEKIVPIALSQMNH